MNRAQRRKDKKAAQKAAKKGANNFGAEGQAFMELIDQGRNSEAIEQAQALSKKYSKNAFSFFWLGTVLWKSSQLEEALIAYQRALKLNPKHVPSQGNLGNVYFEYRDYEKSCQCFQRLLKIDPKDPQAHYNLGNALKALGDNEQALVHYTKANQITPRDPSYLNGKGLALRSLGRYEEAIACFEKALKKSPSNVNFIANLGTSNRLLGNMTQALELYEKACRLSSDNPSILFNLAHLEIENGALDRAITHLEKIVVSADIDSVDMAKKGAQHLLASLRGEKTSTAPIAYVRRLFDEYAKDFERHVQDKLKYSVPQELRRLWDSLAGKSEEKPLALDLGCGTGLVGKAFDGAVRSVVGIDLSPQMLASAAQKNVYDALYEDDIFAYLERTDTKYDLVIAADVLIYLGDFSRVLELLGQQLKANGYFLFSVEATEKEEYALQPSGRYAHNIEYIEAALSDHGLSVLTKEDVVVRYDNDEPLAGHLFVCQKVD